MARLISEQIYKQLKRDLSVGNIHTDGQLLPEKKLSSHYNVAIGTVRKVVSRLIEEGVLERQQGRGTFLIADSKENFSRIETGSPRVSYRWGNAFISAFQTKIMKQMLEGEEKSFLVENMPGASHVLPLREEISKYDILFFTPFQCFSSRSTGNLHPVPPHIQERLADKYPKAVLDSFCVPGTMLMQGIPVIANPTVSYFHAGTFAESGVELPDGAWSWDDCLDIARKLKKINPDKAPIALHPSPGCLYEPLLWYFGGDYFTSEGEPWLPEGALTKMVNLLQTLYNEGLATNLYKISVSYPEFVSSRKVPISFCGPLLGAAFPDEVRSEWVLHPIPSNRNCSTAMTIFGMGVPAAVSEPDYVWDCIYEFLFERNAVNRAAKVDGVFPASLDAMRLWTGGGVGCPEIMPDIAKDARPVSPMTGFIDWYVAVYNVFDSMVCGKISVMEGRGQILEELSKHPILCDAGFLI